VRLTSTTNATTLRLVLRLLFIVPLLLSACFSTAHAANPTSYFVKGPSANPKKLVIFVHGILGDSGSTWTNIQTGAFWPKLVADDPDFQGYDVYVYGYLSPHLSEASNIAEIASRMGQQLGDRRIFDRYEQIFFIAHSAGGLVTKRMLDILDTPAHIQRLKKVRCALYLSVPSNGSDLAALASWLSSNPQFNSISPRQAADFLQAVEADWAEILRERSPSSPFPRTSSAYEKLPTKGFTIVPELYSTPSDSPIMAFDKNHSDIVKPNDRSDEVYEWAKARILEASAMKVDGRNSGAPGASKLGHAKTDIVAELAPFAWNWYTHTMIRPAPGQDPQDSVGLSYGLTAILMVQNKGSHPAQVQALEVVGDAPVSEQDWAGILDFNHRKFSRAEWDLRKPFIELSWVVWQKDDVRVQPGEQKFVRFVIANPKDRYQFENSFGSVPSGGGPDFGMIYIGLRNPDIRPDAVVRIPTIWPVIQFTSYIKSPVQQGNNEFRSPVLKKEITDGSVKFRVRLSSGERYVIPPQNVRAAQLVLQDEWEHTDVPIQDLFYGRIGWNRAEPIKKDPLMDIPK
jgi:pimeloyl-ACP methyl ester carboxylesterase